MPLLSGMEAGPGPLPAPRQLPKGFALRTLCFSNLAVILGFGFFCLSSLLSIAMLKGRELFAIVTILGALVSLAIFFYGWNRAMATLRAFRHGTPVLGEAFSVTVDTYTTVEGRHPWRFVYRFTAEGEQHEGVITTLDAAVASHCRGQPLWVLFVPGDPEQNTLYPAVQGSV